MRAGGRVAEQRAVHIRRPCILLSRQPDVKIGTQRLCNILAEVSPETFAGYPSHHLTHEKSVGKWVIAMCLAGRPPGLLRCQGRTHDFPDDQRTVGQRCTDTAKPGFVSHQPTLCDVPVAECCELGPVSCYRRLVIHLSLLDLLV